MSDEMVQGRPVEDFDLQFEWHDGRWKQLFDEQLKLVRSDLLRARMSDKLVVYLSCPISGRGGGDSGTNVDIALATERDLLNRWGEGVWILNPANYQMESRAGTGLMNMHAERLGIDLDDLVATTGLPRGGDYMRMWTKILVENDAEVGRTSVGEELFNSGQFFDAYYFLGPSDAERFFKNGGESLTTAVESYFARRMETDCYFRDTFNNRAIVWGDAGDEDHAERNAWQHQRLAFLRFYLFRAGVNFSLGSHDEWNIWRMLNVRRRAQPYGISDQIGGFFEGRQIDLSSFEGEAADGYAR